MNIKDEVTCEVVKAAAENPHVRAAGHELSKALVTLAKSVNVLLLPLAALNSAAEKARIYYQTRFGEELAIKLPQNEPLAEPRASIAGPALLALAYAHEEPDLKELYLNLLAAELIPGRQPTNHPGFVEILRQIPAAEARVLRVFARDHHAIYVWVDDTGRWKLQGDFDGIRSAVENDLGHDSAVVMFENWIRLGLCRVDTDLSGIRREIRAVMDIPNDWTPRTYNPLPPRTEQIAVVMTAFGHQFAKAVGIT